MVDAKWDRGACYCPISWFYQLKCNGYFQIHKTKTGFGEDIKVLYIAARLQPGFVDKVVRSFTKILLAQDH